MVGDGIVDEVYVTFIEGGQWWPLSDIDVKEYYLKYGNPFKAIRRGCICYDYVLKKLGYCPWRYVPPMQLGK